MGKYLFRRVMLSLLVGCLLFFSLLFAYKLVNGYSVRRQNVKSVLANAVIGCLKASKVKNAIDCQLIFKNIESEVSELRFEVWVLDSRGQILWQNSSVPAPQISAAFGETGRLYNLIERRRIFSVALPVPNGFVDDTETQTRVVIGNALSTNNSLYLRNQILISIFILFLAGILLSSVLSFFVLSRRAQEAKRILRRFAAGDLTARFKVGGLDELSELSSSFNQMVDLLSRSLKEVKESEVSRRSLVAELSHDLRTPLTSMTSFIQILNRSESLKSDLEKECLASIKTEINYLNQLAGSLFELSRIESPQVKAERTLINLKDSLDEVASDFALTAKLKKINFESQILSGEISVLGDPILARRMLSNLLENTLRFARSSVFLRAEVDSDQRQVHIIIQDDGPGFSGGILEGFGKGPRRRSVTADSSEMHLGLGSMIATKIVQLHEGEIKISNLPTGGANISITLPLTAKIKV